MVKSDPSPAPLLDVVAEGFHGCGFPRIRRVVQLNKQLVLRQERLIDLVRVLDVVDREIVLNRLFSQPYLGGINERLVDTASFRDGNHPKLWMGALAPANRAGQKHDEAKSAKAQLPKSTPIVQDQSPSRMNLSPDGRRI